ncbi:pssA [Wigglesworthia glossinidia endosymbiont of Glossina brevipalpis]|uniref:PssA protein n=1 Tax=Wigglesworthia glossinidia brevipalpis TaxID=36870 RepID=Q8D367_WIGBR|nr:pssA [Wigglesworthia glossinidia endosymbiont of Glossina brevipalpis]
MVIKFNFDQEKCRKYLIKLPKINQNPEQIITIYNPKDFFDRLIKSISKAKKFIYLVALYLEKDQSGNKLLKEIYKAKNKNPNLEVTIIVDLNRSKRRSFGEDKGLTNSDWYLKIAKTYKHINVPIYGIPLSINEALGVLHLKGFIIDDHVFYSGASINNAYLNKFIQYRYDRYHIIYNRLLANSMLNFIKTKLLAKQSVRLNTIYSIINKKNFFINRNSRAIRKNLKSSKYIYISENCNNKLSITPILGLGKKSLLNSVIHNLVCSTYSKMILCTPYFNLFSLLIKDISNILKINKSVEIIVGDKISNDFYIPDNIKFNITGIIPYLYEINLRRFMKKNQKYIDNGNLTIKIWKNNNNSFHIKGIWIDKKWILLTGNNFNSRSWYLDLENAILIHDPKQEIKNQFDKELIKINKHTTCIKHFKEVENISNYPSKIRKIIRNINIVQIDRLIKKIL